MHLVEDLPLMKSIPEVVNAIVLIVRSIKTTKTTTIYSIWTKSLSG